MTFALLSGNSNAVELASEQYTRPSGNRYTTIACLLPGMMTDLIIFPVLHHGVLVLQPVKLIKCNGTLHDTVQVQRGWRLHWLLLRHT